MTRKFEHSNGHESNYSSVFRRAFSVNVQFHDWLFTPHLRQCRKQEEIASEQFESETISVDTTLLPY